MIFFQARKRKISWRSWSDFTHPQCGNHGGVSEASIFILEVVPLRPLVSLTDFPQLHSFIWERRQSYAWLLLEEHLTGMARPCQLASKLKVCYILIFNVLEAMQLHGKKPSQKMQLSPWHLALRTFVLILLLDNSLCTYYIRKKIIEQKNRTIR